MGEEPEGLTGTGGVTSASRSDRDFDPGRAGFGEIHGEGGEQRGERVCGIAVQRVLELRVAAEGKDVRAETEIHRPRAVAGWQGKGIIGQPCDRGIGIVGAELTEEGRFKFRRDAREEADGLGVRSDDEGDGVTTGIRLVDGGEDLLHILGPAQVSGRDADGEEHWERRYQKDRRLRGLEL